MYLFKETSKKVEKEKIGMTTEEGKEKMNLRLAWLHKGKGRMERKEGYRSPRGRLIRNRDRLI